MGRPSKLTPDVQERIVNALNAGNYLEVAAGYAGISPSTLHNWIARGKAARARMDAEAEAESPEPCPTCQAQAGEPCRTLEGGDADHPHTARIWRPDADTDTDRRYVEFVEAVESARAVAQVQMLAVVRRAAAEGAWQAAAWFLERSNPQQWGRRTLEVSGVGGGPIEFAEMSPDEKRARLEAVREEIARRLGTE